MSTDTKTLSERRPHPPFQTHRGHKAMTIPEVEEAGVSAILCAYCDGRGWVGPVFVDRVSGGEWLDRIECTHCGSTGRWDRAHLDRYVEGRSHRDTRVARGESLRECATRLGITPTELSSFETGRSPFPRTKESSNDQ